MEQARYRVTGFPASRLATIDLGRVAQRKHHVVALLELDVTRAVRRIHQLRQAGTPISFFAWFVHTVGAAVATEPAIHALQNGKRQLLLFDDVDVSVLVEREVGTEKVPLPLLLRACNKKSIAAIHQEVRAAQSEPIAPSGRLVLGGGGEPSWMRLYWRLPGWLRRGLLAGLTRDPERSQRKMGTVVITSVGSVAQLSGWFIPRSLHNLCFGVGSIVRKPWAVGEAIELREILHLTVLFNHDVIDGAPAARFLGHLAQRLESEWAESPVGS